MEKPTTHQRDLAKLPRALAPLIKRPQWCVWRWTQEPNRKWQKPPFIATRPDQHARSNDRSTWGTYADALAAVQAGLADGITYMLAEDDPFAAIDLDHCRDPDTRSIDIWAQLFLERGRDTYSEVTPSGNGVRIWGLASGAKLHRKLSLKDDGKLIAAELFRRTNKPLTITGWTLDPAIRELACVDSVSDWGVIWGGRRKAAAAPPLVPSKSLNGGGTGCNYTVEEIDRIIRAGAPAGENRSDIFHAIIGHLIGCGWSTEQAFEHLQQFPDGIGAKYVSEGRLALEISRSFRKFSNLPPLVGHELAQWTTEWMNGSEAAEAAGWAARTETKDPELRDDFDDPELQDDHLDDPKLHEQPACAHNLGLEDAPEKPTRPEPPPDPDADFGIDDDDLGADGDLGDDDLKGEEPKEVGMSASVLCATVFEPPNYAVPGYIVEGLTLLAGKPKVGKSWLMLHVGIAVACGSFTLDDIHCVKGDVLYAALEDNKRRLQRRLRKLLNGRPAPERLRVLSAGEMPRLNEGGAALIRAWIEQAPEPRLVVVDVLAKVRDPRRKDQGLYDSDYAAMEELKKIADEYGLAIVVIHHLRKMDAEDPLDQVSGTTGLSGSADTVLVLNKIKGAVTLHGRGRDIEDIEKAVQFDEGTCVWTVLGSAAGVQYAGQRAAVLAALRDAGGPMSLADIAATAGMKAENTRKTLASLIKDGAVRRVVRGQYELNPDRKEG